MKQKTLYQAALLIFLSFAFNIKCSKTMSWGVFEFSTDVGNVRLQGSAEFEKAENKYRITGSGENMWGKKDAFHFLFSKTQGDLVLVTDIAFSGAGKNEHRKAGWMVRKSLAADAPYADAVVHGNGLISLQYRREKGDITREIQAPFKAPATLKFEKDGDVFTLSVSKDKKTFAPVGAISLSLGDTVFTGLAVCSHDSSTRETAVFSNVRFEKKGVFSAENRVTESTLEIINIETTQRRIVYRAGDHFEAPNWSKDGEFLIFNSHGKLYQIPVTGGTPTVINSGTADHCNNDHGFSPDGKLLALSNNVNSTSLIYVIPAHGGTPKQITTKGPSYWHGWSPDGKTLAYCARRNGEYDVYTISKNGGRETRLTHAPGLDDGPDYSPDGKYIYFNSVRTGLMQIWRMRTDGSQQQQVTFDDHNDWFPHPSPDGKWIVFLSYEKNVVGHPANKNVKLRLLPIAGGEAKSIASFFGGQGTINVPSWSPDSREFAFVSYRLVGRREK